MTVYCTSQQIADYMGRALTGAEQAQADVLAVAATNHVDRLTHRTWQNTGSVSGEEHPVEGPFVYLTHKPVTAVTTATARSISVGAPVTVLTAGQDYELLDAGAGLLSFFNWFDLFGYGRRSVVGDISGTHYGKLVAVDYTTSEAVPADIQLAAAMVAADWLQTPDSLRVKSMAVDGQSVTYGDVSTGVQAFVDRILRGYKRLVFA